MTSELCLRALVILDLRRFKSLNIQQKEYLPEDSKSLTLAWFGSGLTFCHLFSCNFSTLENKIEMSIKKYCQIHKNIKKATGENLTSSDKVKFKVT